MKAIVIGGAGFVGSHLVEALLNKGLEVVSIDNYSRGDERNLANLDVQKVECDVRDKAKMRPYFKGVDWVFHEAALKNFLCTKNPWLGMEINEGGVINALELSMEVGVKKFIYASSASVYGGSAYGVSKRAAEGYVQMFHRHHGLDTTILRYFHVYGPKANASEEVGDVIPKFIRRLHNDLPLHIYGNGSQERAYTYVADIIVSNLLAAESEEAIGQTYNCTSGIKVTIQEMAEKLCALMGKDQAEFKYSTWRTDDSRTVPQTSIDKMGPTSWTPFDIGLKKTAAWYLHEGLWAI